MSITNQQLADVLLNIADFLEETEDNPYRVRAYRRAANTVSKYPKEFNVLIAEKIDLTSIRYIGERLAKVIEEIILSENLQWLPHTKSAQDYPEHLLKIKQKKKFFRIFSVKQPINRLLNRLKAIKGVMRIECAGEFRRNKEVISSVEILIVADNLENIFQEFHKFSSIKYILNTDLEHTAVQLKMGLEVTLIATTDQDFASKLLEKTGSIEHYEILETIAKERNFSLVENKLASEKEIYQRLDLEFIPAELRENRGEILAARENKLPKLVTLQDIKGDLHCHTNETDGSFTLEEMVEAAIMQGYHYIAITDHSKSLRITNGMDEKRLLEQIKLIDKLNEKYTNLVILKSMEVDILEDGSLDLDNHVLKELDLTVCSIHSKFRLPQEKQTERVLRAMDSPYFNILGHATGRLIHHRPPYQIDIDRILFAAKERHCFIEVNAQPARLDINDIYCKKAKEVGVKVAISSDAHTTKGFDFMSLGVNQARRGWLSASDVINTYDLKQLKALLKR